MSTRISSEVYSRSQPQCMDNWKLNLNSRNISFESVTKLIAADSSFVTTTVPSGVYLEIGNALN